MPADCISYTDMSQAYTEVKQSSTYQHYVDTVSITTYQHSSSLDVGSSGFILRVKKMDGKLQNGSTIPKQQIKHISPLNDRLGMEQFSMSTVALQASTSCVASAANYESVLTLHSP